MLKQPPRTICPRCGSNNRFRAAFCNSCGSSLPLEKLPIGEVLDRRYTITGVLGEGGMGVIYTAADERQDGAAVVIKELLVAEDSPTEQQAIRARFESEARTLATLHHTGIPRVYMLFTEAGRPYLVMDLVPGKNLEEILKGLGGQGLPPELVVGWAIELCGMLDYLHRQSPPLIFRDLKPANIIVQPAGTITLVDFGTVRRYIPGKARDTQPLGTPGYAAPEQYGRAQTDPRTDIYGLGATLFHLLSGHDPQDYTALPLPRLGSLVPGIRTALEEIVARSVEVDPRCRYSSALDMLAALQQVLRQVTTKQRDQARRLLPLSSSTTAFLHGEAHYTLHLYPAGPILAPANIYHHPFTRQVPSTHLTSIISAEVAGLLGSISAQELSCVRVLEDISYEVQSTLTPIPSTVIATPRQALLHLLIRVLPVVSSCCTAKITGAYCSKCERRVCPGCGLCQGHGHARNCRWA